MSRRRAIQNSVRANALLAAIVVLVNRENRASHASRESLVNRVVATGLPAAWIVAIAAQATGVHVTLIAEIEAVTAAVAATVEIVANVRRCANARRWIEIVDRAMIAVDVATAIAGRVILIVETVADAKIVAARAITIVLAKAIVVHVIMIVLLPVVAAVTVIMIVHRNVVEATATSASAIVITHRAVNRCATILRVAEIPVVAAVAANRDQQLSTGGLRPAFFISASPSLVLPARERPLEQNLHPTPPTQ
jgi:hypothetical protein